MTMTMTMTMTTLTINPVTKVSNMKQRRLVGGVLKVFSRKDPDSHDQVEQFFTFAMFFLSPVAGSALGCGQTMLGGNSQM